MVDRQQSLAAINRLLQGSRPLPREVEIELVKAAQQGDCAAREKVVRANLRFAFQVANKHIPCYAQQFPDVFQAACVGLNRAIDKFETQYDAKFISYAVWWIAQSIKLQLNSDGLIHIPLNLVLKNNRYRRENKAKIATGELPPNLPGIPSIGRIDLSFNASGEESDPEQSAAVTRATTQAMPDAERELIENDLRETLDKLIGELDQRSGHILYAIFGIDGEAQTLQQIADDFGISRERVRQIKILALKRLKKTVQVRRLDNNLHDLLLEPQ